MFLLPPSPKPFGLFAEKAESITDDLRIAQEVERRILEAAERRREVVELLLGARDVLKRAGWVYKDSSSS